MRVFTKINGSLACWQIDDVEYIDALEIVRSVVEAETGKPPSGAVLALVKY